MHIGAALFEINVFFVIIGVLYITIKPKSRLLSSTLFFFQKKIIFFINYRFSGRISSQYSSGNRVISNCYPDNILPRFLGALFEIIIPFCPQEVQMTTCQAFFPDTILYSDHTDLSVQNRLYKSLLVARLAVISSRQSAPLSVSIHTECLLSVFQQINFGKESKVLSPNLF